MAQSAVAAVRKGCEMLADGKAEIDKFKKTVEKGVGDARAIYKEVRGIWSWIRGLFGVSKPAAPIPSVKTAEPETAKPAAKEAQHKLSYEEHKVRAINDVCEHLKRFFEIRRQLNEYCRELEEEAKTTTTIEDSAIDRVKIEIQLEDMSKQVRETMVYAPSELRDIYSRFLKMYDQILEEQEFARQLKKRQDRDAKWRREILRNHRIDRMVTTAAVLVLLLEMWALMLSLGWLARTQSGL